MQLRAKIKVDDTIIPFSRWELLDEVISMMVPDSMNGVLPQALRENNPLPLMGQPSFAVDNPHLGEIVFYPHSDQVAELEASHVDRVQCLNGVTFYPTSRISNSYDTPSGKCRLDLMYWDVRVGDQFIVYSTVKLQARYSICIMFRRLPISPKADQRLWKSMCVYMIQSIRPGIRFEEVLNP